MNSKVTVLVGLVCAVAISVGVWFAKPRVSHTPHGIFLPAKNYTPYTGKPVATIFLIDRFPSDYQALGIINVEQHFAGKDKAKIQRQTLDFAKSLAAKQGATAIVVTQAYFDQPKGPEQGLGSIHFSGIAIKVSQADF
jgi:hypothetical protein